MKAVAAVLSVALVGSLAANFLQYQRYSSGRPVMRMGDQMVSRKEFQDEMEFRSGKAILNSIAYRKIIESAAAKAGVTPTKKDIDERIAEIDRRNSQVLGAVKNDPTKMEMARQNIATNIALENLRIKDIKVTDAEVAAFYNQNKNALAVPMQVNTTMVVAKNSVDAATAKEMLQNNMKPETIARQPRLRVVGVGGFSLPPNLPPAFAAKIKDTAFHTKVGSVTLIPAGTAFLVMRSNHSSAQGVPAFAQVKPLVTRMCKLSQAPAQERVMAQLYKDANVTFEADRYAPYFREMQDAASHLDTNDTKAVATAKP